MKEIPVLYEDERLLAVAKPAGRLVVAGRGPDSGIPLAEELSAAAGRKLFVVHRLDRETSGVLLFAKDATAHRALNELFEHRGMRKRYLALVQGLLRRPLQMDQPLAEFGSGRVGVRPDGKPSRTALRPLEQIGGIATFVEALPATGRRHQVRVHLYAAGHPILGDPLYGKPDAWSKQAPRLMLHASELSFELEGRRYAIACPRPEDFSAFLERLRAVR